MKKLLLRAVAPCTVAVCLIALAAPALGHERRTSGATQAVVGWSNEPAYVGFPNAVEITLSDQAGRPITDLGADDLKVEVSFGGQKTAPLPVQPAFSVGSFGTPGEYHADLIPTRGGEYAFRFFGTVKGQPYDQSYTSGEGTFDSPRNPADVSFPAKDPTAGELAASIRQLSNRNDAGAGDPGGRIALGVAVLALLVAVAGFVKKGRPA